MPDFTTGQMQGLEMVRTLKTYDKRPRIGILAGLAGTGKTWLLQHIREDLDGTPAVVAPTGKAAARVRDSTGLQAQTLHSWMYNASEDLVGEVTYERKDPEQMKRPELPILICDEASMVGEDLWNDLYETCVVMRMNILLVGDPFQLPPVQKKNEALDENSPPRSSHEPERLPFNLMAPEFRSDQRVVLLQIVRQALESPIIRAATFVREGHLVKAVMMLDRVFPRDFVARAAEFTQAGGGVIVHKNETRLALNRRIRDHLGHPQGELVAGEPLLVLQNSIRTQLFNGETPVFVGWGQAPGAPLAVKDGQRKVDGLARFGIAVVAGQQVSLSPERVLGKLDKFRSTVFAKKSVLMYGTAVGDRDLKGMSKEELDRALGPPYLDANMGYVLTCHKAQGSEWPRVLIALEPSVNTKYEEGLRWAYTALTRARESVSICAGTPS